MGARRWSVVAAVLGGLVVATAGAGSAAPFTPRAAAARTGPVLSYPFSKPAGTTVVDRSGHGLDGVLVDATAPSAYGPGRPGHGKALDLVGGQHQYVDVGDAAALDVDHYTLAAWVRYTGVPNDLTRGRWEVMEKAGAYWLNIRTTGQVRAGGFYGGCDSADWTYLDTPKPVPVDTWTHLAATYDGSTLTIWVDGQRAVSRAVSGTTCASDQPLAVGAKDAPDKGLLEAFFDGSLDDVRIYDRALTASQIAALAR